MGTTIKKRLAQSNIAMLVIPLLVAAALLLRRIAVNLLDNSRKYGGQETVHVHITAEQRGGAAAISFTDAGVDVRRSSCPGCLMISTGAMQPGQPRAAASAADWRW